MAIDTLAKRNSALSFSTMLLPVPDGTIDQGDRQTTAFSYAGILASGAVAVAVATYQKISIRIGVGF